MHHDLRLNLLSISPGMKEFDTLPRLRFCGMNRWKDSVLELSALVSASKLGIVAGSTLRAHVLSLSRAISGL
jgi:hypothetical protein